ncbi:MAG: TIGR03067 domain-containing protein [Gemmataceae bacterium]|nr:TIGR03067 domain-containing protein [Gemmataceae bacterium]MCI0743757.1 TIGR03067 domain-containing protein [Gemmataceae bacterium]
MKLAILFLSFVFAGQSAETKKDLALLQGAWKLSTIDEDGTANESNADFARWIVKGNKVFYGGEEFAELQADPSTTPKSLDLRLRKGKRELEAVYAIEGDVWKICVNRSADGVKERPLDFSTKDKPDRRLLVFNRDKSGKPGGVEGAGFVGIAIRAHKDKDEVSVDSTLEGSPAQKSGLKKGDILLTVDNKDATDLPTTVRLVREAKAGAQIVFRIRRDGKEMDVTVKAGVLPFFPLD